MLFDLFTYIALDEVIMESDLVWWSIVDAFYSLVHQ